MTDSVTTQESRARILLAVENAADPMTVEDIADRTGLHANTVRAHLDVLMAAGSISRTAADAHGRGRPRWLYRAASPVSSPFQVLAEALSMQLTQVADPALAGRAADQWAQALPDLPRAATPDEAVAEATDALNGLGFTAVANPRGDAITLTDCPYAELVDANPIICDIHAALVARLLTQTGQPVTVESVVVWTRPGMCAAHLRRPDLVPARIITADDRGTFTSNERSTS